MKLSRLLQIIKEEVQDFFSDWSTTDEPSLADKYYQKQGIDTKTSEPENIGVEPFDYVNTMYGRPMKNAIPIYKNLKNLQGIDSYARGILVKNGDLYIAQSDKALHDDFLEVLAKHGVVPLGKIHQYWVNFPVEFIAVQRNNFENEFAPSTVYDEFPFYYGQMFDEANQKQPFKFNPIVYEQTQSPLDPNWIQSNIPQGHEHNILDEFNAKKH